MHSILTNVPSPALGAIVLVLSNTSKSPRTNKLLFVSTSLHFKLAIAILQGSCFSYRNLNVYGLLTYLPLVAFLIQMNVKLHFKLLRFSLCTHSMPHLEGKAPRYDLAFLAPAFSMKWSLPGRENCSVQLQACFRRGLKAWYWRLEWSMLSLNTGGWFARLEFAEMLCACWRLVNMFPEGTEVSCWCAGVCLGHRCSL